MKKQMQKKKITLFGDDNQSVDVLMRVSAKAKNIAIKITHHKGVELVAPRGVSYKNALMFLYSKKQWVFSKICNINVESRTLFEDGVKIPILGNDYTITYTGSLRGVTYIEGDKLYISGDKRFISKRVGDFLKKYAKDYISKRAEIESEKLKVNYNRITVRDTNSRWGSCSRKKNLSFSWRLILAPKDIMEYVVAHEIAHLIEMNHGPNFWLLVDRIFPNYKKAKEWLRINGSSLHLYGE